MKTNCKREKGMRRTKKMLLTLMVCLIGIFAFSITGEAASKPQPVTTLSKSAWVHVYSKDKNMLKNTFTQVRPDGSIYFTLAKKGTIKNAKSSNTKVVKVLQPTTYKDASGKYNVSLYYQAKKAGTATISFDLKYNGKTYHYSQKIKVVNYENPFKTLKIGKTNYASQFNKKCYANAKKVSKQKISVSLKKNWTIKKMKLISSTRKNVYIPVSNTKGTTVKNGQKITASKKILGIELKNKSTGIVYTTYIYFS